MSSTIHPVTDAPAKKLGGVTGKGFMPGQSGNPAGRSKNKPITAIYEELLADPEVRELIKQAIKIRLTSGRMVGSMELKEMLERLEGKVKQSVELDGELAVLTLAERMQKARERAKEVA